ncbi:uncharacterized protein LOC122511787 [Leptopilina heterotoma]|uniref:uncharacterized protein LOC122511787 n=1 Tax=Leptopilina heterotoma TaxID=63436 RepID=UPI001CA8C182|nr:uncharacterized protein LOC122511787 [Leptopilina heterotoma]XP_043483204.1 uncharacterized protein LOC122511787 [Leptopilina heterotoma]
MTFGVKLLIIVSALLSSSLQIFIESRTVDASCLTYDIERKHPDGLRVGILTTVSKNGLVSKTYSCGFYHAMKGSETITCLNGKWSDHPPSCKEYIEPSRRNQTDILDETWYQNLETETETTTNQDSEVEIYDV